MLAMHESLLNFRLFIAGRAIFGMGMAGTLIWYSSINNVFFFYTNNAMSMAILVCFSAFGATLTGIVLPILYAKSYSISRTLMVPIYAQLLALLCVFGINKIETLSTKRRNNLRYIRMASRKL